MGFLFVCLFVWLPSGFSPLTLVFITVNLVIPGMCVDYIFISHEYTPRNGIARSCGNCVFNILRKCQAVFQAAEPFLLLSATHEPSSFSTSLPALVITVLLKWHLTVLLSY